MCDQPTDSDRTFTAWDVAFGFFYAICAGALMWLLGMAAATLERTDG